MTELLPCPFCGGEAQVMKMDLDSIEEGWKVWGVWCVDDLHAEEHGGYQHGHYIDNYVTEAEAIETWNTRAEMSYEDVLILLDELGLSEETCKMFQYRNALGLIDEYQCSECGSDVEGKPNYCPNCGRRVVE